MHPSNELGQKFVLYGFISKYFRFMSFLKAFASILSMDDEKVIFSNISQDSKADSLFVTFEELIVTNFKLEYI